MIDTQIASTCPARHSCKMHNVLCNTGCPLWIEIRYQTEMSGIPKRHRKYTLPSLPDDTVLLNDLKRFGEDIIKRVDSGMGLYLYGNTGSGKTTALCAIAMHYIVEASKRAVNTGQRTAQFVQYLNVPDLLAGLKRGFDDPDEAARWQAKMASAKSASVLVLDDIGSEKPSEWARERITELIGYRYDYELCTFISSNLTLPELKEHIDPIGRITSRIKGMSVPVQYVGKDRRNKL